MPRKILILQPQQSSAQELGDYFNRHGDQVFRVSDTDQAREIARKNTINIAFIDLHMPGDEWLRLVGYLRKEVPGIRIIVTNRVPDVRREWLAREQGVKVFLREPFAATWIEKALQRLEAEGAQAPALQQLIPKVRFSIRTKITLPYALLAVLIVLAGAYIVFRFVQDSTQERFNNQLYNAGSLSSDWMVQEESSMLETLRLLSHTEGMAEAIQAGDSTRLRVLVLPVAANAGVEAVDILDLQGSSLMSLHHTEGGGAQDYTATQGDATFRGWDFVQKVINAQVDTAGDKYAGLVEAPWGNYFYISGPVLDATGKRAGILLIGQTLKTLVQQDRNDTLAQITIYAKDGRLLASTLFLTADIQPLDAPRVQQVLAWQDQRSFLRNLNLAGKEQSTQPQRDLLVASSHLTEILGPWEARGGEDLGVVGVALTENLQILPKAGTSIQAYILVGIVFISVIGLGILVAGQLVQPLKKVVLASSKVAEGNLDIRVPSEGNDEVAVVAHAFNYMVSGLQEGFIYRDILGRTVSPEVRETLRRSFEKGDLRLEGQNTVATVLMSDIRGFTSLSEKEQPTTILNWLNEYFGELVPIITSFGGVVDKFEGDALLAYFGLLPTPLPPADSAYAACQAMSEMIKVIDRLNMVRKGRGEPLLITGISANTGMLTVGGLGRADRLNYTVIGDTVNTTQRLQSITREFGESGAVISEGTLTALMGRRGQFLLEPLGEHALPGKLEMLWVYRLKPVEAGSESGRGVKEGSHASQSA